VQHQLLLLRCSDI